MSGIDHQQPDKETECGIKAYQRYAFIISEQQVIFVREGREGGETAAETCNQQQSHLGTHADAAVDEPEQQTDYQTADDIDCKRAVGKHSGKRAS